MECQSVWKWNNVRRRAAEVGEETSETLSEQAGSTAEAAAEGCATSCSERSWWEEDRGGETLEGIGKRSGMGRCQTERARESEWGGGRGGGGDCVVLTSEIVRGEASEWALRSRQRGTRETRSKVTPVIDTLASGKVPDVFFFFLCEWSSNILLSFVELGELMRSLSPSLQSSASMSGEKVM